MTIADPNPQQEKEPENQHGGIKDYKRVPLEDHVVTAEDLDNADALERIELDRNLDSSSLSQAEREQEMSDLIEQQKQRRGNNNGQERG